MATIQERTGDINPINEETLEAQAEADYLEAELPGVDLSEAPPPPGWEDAGLKWRKWGPVLVALGMGIAPHFLRDVTIRRNENQSIVIVVYGMGGTGKTYWSLTASLILDEDFEVERQVLFTREQIMDIISNKTKIKPGQCLIIDESQFTMMSRTFGAADQIELMQHIAALRSRNFIIFVNILDVEMLDKIMKKFEITHKVFMKKRGVGQIQIIKQNMSYTYPENLSQECHLPLPDSWPECAEDMEVKHGCEDPMCLRCYWSGIIDGLWERHEQWETLGFKPCSRQRARMERIKKMYLEAKANESIQKKTGKSSKLTEEVRHLDAVTNFSKLTLTAKNRINLNSIGDLYQELHPDEPRVSEKVLIRDRDWVEKNCKDKFEKSIMEKKAKKT
jgi:hypothetical protein